jgi:MFS transporter, FSR family, fosmidomycin resistance protein
VAAFAVALGIEFVDELADGTKGAALPLIRADLGLSYAQIGLLIGIPLLAGSLLELPLGLIAGQGRSRHRLVLAGGAVVMASLAAVAAARSAGVLLVAFVAFFPASGAFVSLTQAALVDAAPGREQQRLAAWNLAGSAGAVAGPLLLAGVLTAGGGWRSAYLVLAMAAGIALAGAAFAAPSRHAAAVVAGGEHDEGGRRPSVRQALRALRTGDVARWVVLLEITDLLLDVLTGYIGVYLVDVAGASPAEAAIGVAVRLGSALAGDALFVLVSRHVSGTSALRVSVAAAGVLYPAFLLVPSIPAKLSILAALSVMTACWYPVVQAGLYGSLPGRSGIAVFLASAAGLVGAAGPLAVGFIAQQAGLTCALAVLGAAPAVVLIAVPGALRRESRRVNR